MDARNRTLRWLALFESARGAAGSGGAWSGAAPSPWWLAGHLAWFSEYWIARNPRRGQGWNCPAGALRLPSIQEHSDAWWGPHPESGELPPDGELLRAYMLATFETILDLLANAGVDDGALHFYRLALWHEDMRAEGFARLAQARGLAVDIAGPAPAAGCRVALLVPATYCVLGDSATGFVPTAETGRLEVRVPEFEIDAQPVNWAQFAEFVDDGGYDRRECWSADGWEWLDQQVAARGRRAPAYVEQIGSASGAVLQTCFGQTRRMSGDQPATHVSWWEAEAWASWAGRRLPAEVEWVTAARHAARQGFRWGEVHEWTATLLRMWPGHSPEPWADSCADLAATPCLGRARVTRGASFATPSRLRYLDRRGFGLPGQDDAFVGFRTCAP